MVHLDKSALSSVLIFCPDCRRQRPGTAAETRTVTMAVGNKTRFSQNNKPRRGKRVVPEERLCLEIDSPTPHGVVACASDIAGITNTVGCSVFRVLPKRGVGNAAVVGGSC